MSTALKLSREEMQVATNNVRTYFEDERKESLGNIETEQLIEFMVEEIGAILYNHAIKDVRKIVSEKFAQLDDEIYTIEKPVQRVIRTGK